MAGIAQLVEYQIVALAVTGSNPVARPVTEERKKQKITLFSAFLFLEKSITKYIPIPSCF